MSEFSGETRMDSPGVLSPAFIWMELNRRVDSIAHRVERLDEHGSRGVDQLRSQFSTLQRDLTEHEQLHVKAAEDVRTGRRWMIGIVVSLIVPLYPLLGWLLTRR